MYRILAAGAVVTCINKQMQTQSLQPNSQVMKIMCWNCTTLTNWN